MSNSKVNPALVAYLFFAAGCSVTGWFLSALCCLDRIGYALCFFITGSLLSIFWTRVKSGVTVQLRVLTAAVHRAKKSLFPLLFSVTALFVFIAGASNPQNFGDSNSYHIPRILHWLHAHTWFWIPTYDNRMNTRGCVFEWMAIPLLLATGTDRSLFLINWAAFLLFPGLLFQTLGLLGVARRAAWHWMWIFPTGFGFICQAENASCDFLGGFFALAAMNLALASRHNFNLGWVGLSLVAFALSTGTKPFNIFLAPPYLLALSSSAKPFLSCRPIIVGALVLVMTFCSFIPNSVINLIAVHDWSGLVLEPWVLKDQTNGPTRFVVSGISAVMQNLLPPFVPFSHAVNSSIRHFLTGQLGTYLSDHFEATIFYVPGYQSINTAALGPFLCGLMLISLIVSCRRSPRKESGLNFTFWIRISGVVGFIVLLFLSTLSQIGRLAIPFYPFLLFAALGGPTQAVLVRQKWWRAVALGQMTLAIFYLLINPAGPAFPVECSLDLIERGYGKSYLVRLCESDYLEASSTLIASQWQDASLPAKCNYVGLARYWLESESVLWKPAESRQLLNIARDATPGSLRRIGITYAAVSRAGARSSFDLTLDEWRQYFDGRETSFSLADSAIWQIVAIGSDAPSRSLPPPFFKLPDQ